MTLRIAVYNMRCFKARRAVSHLESYMCIAVDHSSDTYHLYHILLDGNNRIGQIRMLGLTYTLWERIIHRSECQKTEITKALP